MDIRTILKSLSHSLALIYKFEPRLAIWIALVHTIGGFTAILILKITQELIDITINSVGLQAEGVPRLLLWFGLFVLVSLLSKELLARIGEPLSNRLKQKLEGRLEWERLDKAANLPLVCYESNELYDNLSMSANPGEKVARVYKGMLQVFQSFIQIITVSILLFEISAIVPILILFIYIFYTMVSIKTSHAYMSLVFGQTETNRRSQYISSIITGRSEQKEIRLFGLQDLLMDRWEKNRKLIRSQVKTQLIDNEKKFIIPRILDFIMQSGVFVWVIIELYNNAITVGMFVVSLLAVKKIGESSSMIIMSLRELFEAVRNKQFYIDFLELAASNQVDGNQGEKVNFPAVLSKGITLRDVSFTYNHSDREILSGIDLHINPGERIAIVGGNGAGKSTLAKLLMLLYLPSKGEICIDDIDYRTIDKHQYNREVGIVFQDYFNFEFTLGQSIGIGNIDYMRKREPLTSKVAIAAKRAGISDLEESAQLTLDTPIGYVLDGGVGLSGGQWQRIAISRTILRESQMLILDEPTASLDPRAEEEVYKQFIEIMDGKTVIVISHRLGIAKSVDRIIVLQNGRIAEQGRHDELIRYNGIYSAMWKEQVKWYA